MADRYETRQRAAVLRALAAEAGYLSAPALHERLVAAGEHIGLATVYRALRAFVANGQVGTMCDRAGTRVYCVLPSPGRGYHLVCRGCRTRIPVDVGVVERWSARVAAEHGYQDSRTIVEIDGVCPDCRH